MDNIHNYYKKNYEYQTKIKTMFDIQDIETNIFYETLENDIIEIEKQGYLNEYLDILENEKLI